MFACLRGLLAGVVVALCLSTAASAGEPARTPKFGGEGTFTLECHGTTTANGTATEDSRTYSVDTKQCAIAPWPAVQCKCIDETISCDNRDEGNPDGLIINRLTTKVVHYRANWKFVGHCKRHSP
ncbi:MAG TPA: hypothetical protein VL049_06755 [Candidatus Dormibacteraeota bacterium]|nr:hypothetical protein [Candidatus Dormibacteraeota bacterium]